MGEKPKSGSSFKLLHTAIQRNSPEMAKLLVQNGADTKERDDQGRTPADVARMHSSAYRQEQGPDRPAKSQLKVQEDDDRYNQGI